MKTFPKVPMCVLFKDSLKGKRSQLYIDSNGEHIYYKELAFIRKVQQWEKESKKKYIQVLKGNYCPIKLSKYLHNGMLRLFGYSTLMNEVDFKYGSKDNQ